MPNPLDILGSLAGGLTTIGAQAAAGGTAGEVEGINQAAKLRYMDALNQLNALHAIKGQLELGMPQTSISGSHLLTKYPALHPRAGEVTVEPLAQPPLNPLQEAQAEAARATAAWRERQATAEAAPKAINPAHNPQLWVDWRAKNPEGSYLDFFNQVIVPLNRQQLGMQTKTDAAGNVTGLIGERDASGKWNVTQIPLGRIGAPQRPFAGTVPVQTTTTTTKITPRKEITNFDELSDIRKALPNVVNEIAGNPNITWNTPGPTVMIKGYLAPVRREDLISSWLRKKSGIEVSTYWDGRSWQLLKAWRPTQREPATTVRTVGPPGAAPPDESDEEEQ